MELWSAEIEAMRPEARQSVAAGFGTINEMIGSGGPYPDDPTERALLARKQFEAVYVASPSAQERTIAGVPCRVFPAEEQASAVYLPFQRGG